MRQRGQFFLSADFRSMCGKLAWRTGERVGLPPMMAGFASGRCHMWVEFVVGSRQLFRGFFPLGSPVFLPSQKPTSPNSSSTRIENTSENHLRLSDTASSLNIVVYLFYLKVS